MRIQERMIVDETRLKSIGYRASRGDMEVEMQDGEVYLYLGVPAPTYLALMNAEDKDIYFTKHIENIFVYRKD